MLNIGHPVAAFGGYTVTGREPAVTSFEIDSRDVQEGCVFVAFAGEQVDGHKYVPKAFESGAAVAIVERPLDGYPAVVAGERLEALPDSPFCLVVESTMTGLQQIARYWRSHFEDLIVIGITGSIGKTSTKELMWTVLSNRFSTLKTPKNYNNEIGLPLTILQLRAHHTHAVLEMGMYTKGEIALLCDIARPQVGVMTIIGPVHMSRLGSIEAIVEAKRELPEALPDSGIAVLNKDDDYIMSMADHTQAQVFTYGLDPSADLWADDISSMGLEGIAFTLHHTGEAWHISVPLLGRHSVHTALRATAAGLAVGMTMDEITVGLKSSKNQMRLLTVRGPNESLILDDTYNASPDSVIAALNLLEDLTLDGGRKIAVLGDMLELGAAEEEGHRKVGRRALQVADILVTVGERGKIIGVEALDAGMPEANVHILASADQASEFLQSIIESTDIILVKGSLGARMDRIVANLSRSKGTQ